MTWEHWTIAALWVLGAVASAGAVKERQGSFGVESFIALGLCWPAAIAGGLCAGIWERVK